MAGNSLHAIAGVRSAKDADAGAALPFNTRIAKAEAALAAGFVDKSPSGMVRLVGSSLHAIAAVRLAKDADAAV